jgi:hypothetical protein
MPIYRQVPSAVAATDLRRGPDKIDVSPGEKYAHLRVPTVARRLVEVLADAVEGGGMKLVRYSHLPGQIAI